MASPLSASDRVTVESAYDAFWLSTGAILKVVAYDTYVELDSTAGGGDFAKTDRACATMSMLFKHEDVTSTQKSALKTAAETLNAAVWTIFEAHDGASADDFEPGPDEPEPWPEPQDPDGDFRRLMVAGSMMARLGT